jgi:hypothetical protein
MKKITLPKRFVGFFEGSSVAAGEPNMGYPGGPAVFAAWCDAEWHKNGTATLTFDDADWQDALDCLDDYAESSYDSAESARSGCSTIYEREDYRAYSAEMYAARRLRQRIAELRG